MSGYNKTAEQFTELELRDIFTNDPKNAKDIKSIYLEMIEELKSELNTINQALSEFNQRTSILMTISGLLAFLPSLTKTIDGYVEYFLLWTFPFLLMSFIFFYLSSPRITAVKKEMVIPLAGTANELIVLKSKLSAITEIWKMNLVLYDKVLEYYRITNSLLYIYIFSFSINFYIFVFIDKPDTYSSICMTISLVGFAIYLVLRTRLLSKKNIAYGTIDPVK